MQYTDFRRNIEAEFGDMRGPFMLNSHVLREYGKTPNELIEQGEPLRDIWWAICDDFEIPELRRLGPDD
ncbi:DUF3046 domain-containing protein [Corynebacterium mendelii]|uniref:DUF3046 domain-containing protein n=1 Tax=Corynebacterium mendelii TaxID=2765362 RepID=A0A939DYS2_9CORY|nr:DUF3046 domain-containing protein [Corynebacterium mendelii]MBN9643305.1 DUF3046 domain-containing protein [Corynebacterium mendelii]